MTKTALNISSIHRHATEITRFAGILSNETRLRILCLLMNGPRRVTDLSRTLNAEQSLISQNLKLLRLGGLVAMRRIGRSSSYHIADKRIEPLLTAFDSILEGLSEAEEAAASGADSAGDSRAFMP